MNEQELIDAYNILAQNVQDQTAQNAAIIGNSQRSLGTLASRVASPTGQTSGLANYTYNRLMRPVVDSTAAALTTQGTAQALNKNLADALRAAKAAYEDAQNRYTVASTVPATSGMEYSEEGDGTTPGTLPEAEPSTETGGGADLSLNTNAGLNQFAENVSAVSQVTGGGKPYTNPNAVPFSYNYKGKTVTGVVYPKQGMEINGQSFNREGAINYLKNLVSSGATINNHLGNPVNYNVWMMQYLY